MKKKILVSVVVLVVAITAGVNYNKISASVDNTKLSLNNLLAIASVLSEVNPGSTLTLSCDDALVKTCEGACSYCGKSAKSKGKPPVSISCNCH